MLLVKNYKDVQISLLLGLADVAPHIVLVEPAVRQDYDERTVDCKRIPSVLLVQKHIGFTDKICHSVISACWGLVLEFKLAYNKSSFF